MDECYTRPYGAIKNSKLVAKITQKGENIMKILLENPKNIKNSTEKRGELGEKKRFLYL